MPATTYGPAIDARAFEQLRRDLGDEACASFTERYLDLLPTRLQALTGAVAAFYAPAGETARDAARDAAANLAASSRMLGAHRLAEHLEGLQRSPAMTPAAVRTELRVTAVLVTDVRQALRRRISALRSRSRRTGAGLPTAGTR